MVRIGVTRLRTEISEVVSRVQYAGERTVLERQGKAVAALVPMEDLELLEALEDRYLVELADKAEADSAAKPRVPWEEIKAELDQR